MGELYTKLGQIADAETHYETAIRLTRSEAEKKILREKITRLII